LKSQFMVNPRIADWTSLRLKDRIAPRGRVLFVGINPGVRSAQTGHHFAGYSNRFWKLLYESGLAPEPITYRDDDRLPEWGFGVTNLVARPSPGIDDLKPAEYAAGWAALLKKIEKYQPPIVAFVGVTLYRSFCMASGKKKAPPRCVGFQPDTIHGARVFVLPNPSGRNANFSHAEMLTAFRRLRRAISRQDARAQR
jgi:TDG/mug DNA glycosylase family protein